MCAMLAGLWLIIGSVFGVMCGFMAIPRNRSALPWWALGVLTGPIALGVLKQMGTREGPKALF
ncbi:MAG: hypothetical protein NVSMB57_16960 [Actinomycetota bacterium]